MEEGGEKKGKNTTHYITAFALLKSIGTHNICLYVWTGVNLMLPSTQILTKYQVDRNITMT